MDRPACTVNKSPWPRTRRRPSTRRRPRNLQKPQQADPRKTFRKTFSNSKRRRSPSSSLSDDSDSDDVARRSRCSLEKSSSATRASIVFSWLNGSRTSFSDFNRESFAFLMGGGVNRGGGVVGSAGSSGASAPPGRLRWWRRGCPLLWSRCCSRRCPSCGGSPSSCARTHRSPCVHTFTKAVWSLVCVRQDGRLLQWPQVSHRVTGLRCATAGLRMRSMRSCNAQFPNQMLLLVPYMPIASFSVPKKAAQMLPSAI